MSSYGIKLRHKLNDSNNLQNLLILMFKPINNMNDTYISNINS
jgi:hypothetical protein